MNLMMHKNSLCQTLELISYYLKFENDMEIIILMKTFNNKGFANDGIFEIIINSLIVREARGVRTS